MDHEHTSESVRTSQTPSALGSATPPESREAQKPIDTVSGVTKELLEARSAGTPEAAKHEKLIGAIAIVFAIIILTYFALNA